MVTRRSFVLTIAALVLLVCLFRVLSVSARAAEGSSRTLAVGLLSARDARPVALVAPFATGGRLSVTMVPLQGPSSRHVLAGELFLAVEEGSPATGHAPSQHTSFSVQVASLGTADAAEQFAGSVRDHWPEKEVWVSEAVLGGGQTTHRVMAGRFSDRNSALSFTMTLAAYHMDGAFVVELDRLSAGQEQAGDLGRPLVLYSRSTGLVTGLKRVAFASAATASRPPASADPVFRLDGSPYRGTLEVRGGGAGIVAVNMVALEDYLPGVVPCELGPERFPQLEALKAQAVTARTYAMKHAGRHRGEGFDLCDTPHCQVYGGAGREHPLSSQAVIQTAGLAGYFQGELAETLYTSTCGGHTEISSAVFSGEAPPYLTGVPCTTARRWSVVSIPKQLIRQSPRVSERESGADLGFSLGLLAVLGIIDVGEISGDADAHPYIGQVEAGQWIRSFVSWHRPGSKQAEGFEGGNSFEPPTSCRLALQLCRAMGWRERLDSLFAPADLEEILGPDRGCAEAEQRALAYLITSGIFLRQPDGSVAAIRPMSRGRFAAALSRLALHLEPRLLSEAALSGAMDGTLALRTGEVVEHRKIAPPGILLFERRQDVTRVASAARFRTGDRVLVHLDKEFRVKLMVRLPAPGGASADRYSPYALWSIVMDREAIEALLQGKGHTVGTLVDLQPLDRGPGGRLTRLRAVGTSGSVVLRGLDIRWNLGTRENLFFIDRLAALDGSTRAYRFTGRGWGHGVGMCQVGAAGLADAGATFIEILEHYYPGISIGPAAGASP